ncbi:MAG: dTDP-4-dehydrorhamnose 3,5-epimerase family protein [Pyrinomonadaceae bacterium]
MKRFVDAEVDAGIDFTPEQGLIEGAAKDGHSITADWEPLRELIDGVKVREVKNVPKDNGFLTEIFRADWALDEGEVEQVFQVVLSLGGVSAWHAHQFTTDRLFASHGLIKVVLFDARSHSPTYNRVNEFRIGSVRPTLIVVPPGVWHGVQNLSEGPSLLLNLVNRAYAYEDPDHWRLPPDTPKIPYSFIQPTPNPA